MCIKANKDEAEKPGWQKEAAAASKTNNKETDHVYYLCRLHAQSQRCTVSNQAPFNVEASVADKG